MTTILGMTVAAALACSLSMWADVGAAGAIAIGILCGLIVPRLMDWRR